MQGHNQNILDGRSSSYLIPTTVNGTSGASARVLVETTWNVLIHFASTQTTQVEQIIASLQVHCGVAQMSVQGKLIKSALLTGNKNKSDLALQNVTSKSPQVSSVIFIPWINIILGRFLYM